MKMWPNLKWRQQCDIVKELLSLLDKWDCRWNEKDEERKKLRSVPTHQNPLLQYFSTDVLITWEGRMSVMTPDIDSVLSSFLVRRLMIHTITKLWTQWTNSCHGRPLQGLWKWYLWDGSKHVGSCGRMFCQFSIPMQFFCLLVHHMNHHQWSGPWSR